jgi:hypothetical protein
LGQISGGAGRSSLLRLDLEDFAAHFATRIERAADRISEAKTAPTVDRDAIFLRMRVIPIARRSLRRAAENAVLMDPWLLGRRVESGNSQSPPLSPNAESRNWKRSLSVGSTRVVFSSSPFS